MKVESLLDTLSPIGSLNYDNYVGSSNSVLNKIVLDMKKSFFKHSSSNLEIDSDIFLRDYVWTKPIIILEMIMH